MSKWLLKLLDRFPKRVIEGCEDGSPYLTRRTLFSLCGFNVYLHQFHRSDEGADLHDHPWSFVSVILAGGYWEWTEERHTCLVEDQPHIQIPVRRWKRPGSVLVRSASHAHRVEIDPQRPAWSLVLVGPKWRKWGFYTPNGWAYWRTHLVALGCAEED
jgi:hypothetical protein